MGSMDTTSDYIMPAHDILQSIIKAKKQLKLYPPNNPIYIKASDEAYRKFENLFLSTDKISLQILQNEIKSGGAQIYENPQKDDNLALFFFKDGIRELTFLKGFTREELESFIRILNTDFENVALDDDIVTLLWEEDFEHIKYIVDDISLFDEDSNESDRVFEKAKENSSPREAIIRAYQDGIKADVQQAYGIIPLDENDLRYIEKEIAKNEIQPLIDKVIFIVFELLYQTKKHSHFSEIVGFIEQVMFYCIRGFDLKRANLVVNDIHYIEEKGSLEEAYIKILRKVFAAINSRPFIKEIGIAIESISETDKDALMAFVQNFDKTSIPFFIELLGELNSIKGRRLIIDILSIIGKLDIDAIAKGLDSSEWYVVRNTIIILGKISDGRALEHFEKPLSHPDIRVRKEAVKAMSEIHSHKALPYLRQALDDKEPSIRISAVKALGYISSESAKKILLNEFLKKDFIYREFDEKKHFFEVLANWKDQEVKNFLFATLKKKKLFKKTKNDEMRACAAYAIGIIGDQEAIPLLGKIQNTKNKLLKTYSSEAIKRLTT